MPDIIQGFEPFFTPESEVLILGSFPSVKSRAVQFYYGNRQNRFWKMLYSFFGEEPREDVEEKKAFLARRRVALWDIAVRCSVEGSADATIRAAELADLSLVLSRAPVRSILLNGKTAYGLFCRRYQNCPLPYACLPSTSPANPRYDEAAWHAALAAAFAAGEQAR